jgi:hypothetical protein
MTIELTSEERKALLKAIETHFANVPDGRTPEEIEADRTLKILKVRLTAFDPDATQDKGASCENSSQGLEVVGPSCRKSCHTEIAKGTSFVQHKNSSSQCVATTCFLHGPGVLR